MKCPVDKSDMIVVEHEKIEIDHCLECSGVWLDSGELELLGSLLMAEGSGSRPDVFKPTAVDTGEAGRKCPVCGRKLEKVCLGSIHEVTVDNCPVNDGIWFDSGELHRVLEEAGTSDAPEAKDVLTFLGEAFRFTQGTTEH